MSRLARVPSWAWAIAGVGLVANGLRGLPMLGSGLLVAALIAGLAWQASDRLDVAVLAAALAQATVVRPAPTLGIAIVAGAGWLALAFDDARLLGLTSLAVLLPAPAAWAAPLVGAGLLWAWGSGWWRALALPLATAPLVQGVQPVALAGGLAAGLLAAEAARRSAGSRANLRQARLLADLGLASAPTLGLAGLLAASIVEFDGFVAVLRWSAFLLAGGLIVLLAHLGAAAGLRTANRPRVWSSLTWVPAAVAVGFGVVSGLPSVLGVVLAGLGLACPAAGLGLRSLAGAASGDRRGLDRLGC